MCAIEMHNLSGTEGLSTETLPLVYAFVLITPEFITCACLCDVLSSNSLAQRF